MTCYQVSANNAETSRDCVRGALDALRWAWPRLELALSRLDRVFQETRRRFDEVPEEDGGPHAELTDHARGNVATTISVLREALEAAVQATVPGNYRAVVEIRFVEHRGSIRAGEFPSPDPRSVTLNPHGDLGSGGSGERR